MKKIILIIFFTLILLSNSQVIFADQLKVADLCADAPSDCPAGTTCQRVTEDTAGFRKNEFRCIETPSGPSGVFGNIVPPQAIRNLGFGAEGISQFLSNLVSLIYIIAAIVLIFMLLWGAFDWMTSEGDKEKLQGAQRKILNAIIGIVLFAAAFAIIQILGKFTGFTFFVGQR